MKKTVERANAFLKEHSGKTKGRYRPRYHACVPVGWANDPNGLIFFGGKAHLFCQYNPYHPYWESMHWGHFVSTDLIRWEFLPVALAPDQNYDCDGGCFSGTALEHEGKLILMYTGVAKNVQQQCLAVSEDGVTFEKAAANPVIPASLLPEGCSGRDFRDPKVFERQGIFYCITGVRDGETGDLLLFRSPDLLHWSFVGRLLSPEKDGIFVDGVCECPDYFEADGKELLLFCAMNYPEREGRFQNLHSSLYMTGHLDLLSGRFEPETCGELDGGFDFYAPQTMRLPDGRRVLIAWKLMWGRTIPTAKDGWAGSFTLPRELHIIDGALFQTPVKEIEGHRCGEVFYHDIPLCNERIPLAGIEGTVLELEAVFSLKSAKRAGVVLFQGETHETLVFYDAEAGRVLFDRSQSGADQRGSENESNVRVLPLSLENGTISFRIFLDVSSAEVFLNGGRGVMTGNIYADEGDRGISFFAEGGEAKLLSVRKYDLNLI